MTELVAYLLLFVVVAVGFIFIHLVAGRFIRPVKPDPDKLTIYECGEPTIGSAWVQFDLRYYVVALLFVIFDVEVAFFFPWAVVFGRANTLGGLTAPDTPEKQETYNQVVHTLVPNYPENQKTLEAYQARDKFLPEERVAKNQIEAKNLAWLAFLDIFVFFGVLLVGFAYLWRRGDLDWVRSTAAEKAAAGASEPLREAESGAALVGTERV